MQISRRKLLAGTAASCSFLGSSADAWLPHGAPPLPSGSFPSLLLLSKTGINPTTNITNSNTPDIQVNWSLPPVSGDVVAIYDNGSLAGSHTINGTEVNSGAFKFGLSAFADGVHGLAATYNGGSKGPTFTLTVDTTAPVLSNPLGAQDVTNSSQADISVSTNEGKGVLYWVVTTNGTTPSPAQVIAGEDHSSSIAINGCVFVLATGNQTITAYGIASSSTYFAYFVQEDAAGNLSSVAASSGWTQTVNGSDFNVATTIAPNLWLSASNRFSLWQDGAGSTQINALLSGGTVGQWSDISGNAFNMTAPADTNVRPAYQFDTNGGVTFPSVSFSGPGTNPYLIAPYNTVLEKSSALGLAAAMLSGAGSTICMAVKPNPATGKYLIAEDNNPVTTGTYWDPIASDGTTASKWVVTLRPDASGISINNQSLGTGIFDNTWKVLTFIDDGAGTITARVNGVPTGTTVSYNHSLGGTFSVNFFTLGARAYGGPNNYFAADVAELVIKLSALSGANLTNLEKYVGLKAGISI